MFHFEWRSAPRSLSRFTSRQAINSVLAAVVTLPFWTQCKARAAINHAADDGTSEDTVGFSEPGGGGSFIFANRFTADAGGETITTISISYGHHGLFAYAQAGTPVRLLLFEDTSGAAAPVHPILLASAASSVMRPYVDYFNDVSIPPTNVTGNFFVGVQVSGVPSAGAYPVSFDRTTPRHQSYAAFFSHTIGDVVVNSLGYNPTLISSDVPVDINQFVRVIDGNFMVRATGAAVPEPTTFAVALISLGFIQWRPRFTSRRETTIAKA